MHKTKDINNKTAGSANAVFLQFFCFDIFSCHAERYAVRFKNPVLSCAGGVFHIDIVLLCSHSFHC